MSDLAAELGFDPTLKKKKGKKAVTETVGEGTESGAGVGENKGGDDLFAGLKKKKKKSTPKGEDIATEVSGAGEPAEMDDISEALGELKLKKKKKKKTKEVTLDDFDKELEKAGVSVEDGIPSGGQDGSGNNTEEGALAQQEIGLPYHSLLSRFFKILRANNPELAGDRSGPKFRIPPPVCQRDGKKTIFANVQEISEKLQRSPEHLIQYLFAELGTSGSVDGQKRLVIKGKFQSKQMENVLRRYIMEYVTCKTCKSINTELKKEQSNRLFFLVCKSCGSTRSVSSIKTGFQATVKRKRA